jgi:hypothetical protein
MAMLRIARFEFDMILVNRFRETQHYSMLQRVNLEKALNFKELLVLTLVRPGK